MAQVEDQLGELLVALRRRGMHGAAKHLVDPGRYLAILAEDAAIAQLRLSGGRSRPGCIRTVGKAPRKHLVGDHPEGEEIRSRRARLAEEILRRGELLGAEDAVAL